MTLIFFIVLSAIELVALSVLWNEWRIERMLTDAWRAKYSLKEREAAELLEQLRKARNQ